MMKGRDARGRPRLAPQEYPGVRSRRQRHPQTSTPQRRQRGGELPGWAARCSRFGLAMCADSCFESAWPSPLFDLGDLTTRGPVQGSDAQPDTLVARTPRDDLLLAPKAASSQARRPSGIYDDAAQPISRPLGHIRRGRAGDRAQDGHDARHFKQHRVEAGQRSFAVWGSALWA